MNNLMLLLKLRIATIKNTFLRLKNRSRLEFLMLTFFFVGAAVCLFLFFFHSFRFFQNQEPFGPILVDETFYLLNFTLFLMLLISISVSSYTLLFRSREVPFLLTHPVTWTEIYAYKLMDAIWLSSWALLFVTLPYMTAYGLIKDAQFILFPFLCIAFYVPFILLAGVLGTLAGTLTVWLLPGRKHRRIALSIALIVIGIIFIRIEPQIVKEQGSIAGILSGYLPHVSIAKHPLLPSYWTTRGILALSNIQSQSMLNWQEGIFYFLVLLSNALFFFIPSSFVARRLYPKSYLKSQDFGEVRELQRARSRKTIVRWYDKLPWPSRPGMAFLEKDLRIFARDPSEWSQLIIFFGLLLFFCLNLKNLGFHLVFKEFWKHLVFVVINIGTYFVLSSFNMRFVFPMLSMEGSKSWIIGLAPIRFSSVLLVKLLLGTLLSALLTLPIIFLSGWMLEVPLQRVLYTTGLGFFVCIALTGISVGLGAQFPNFKSNNPSEIISGFGGSMVLVLHLLYLGLVGLFLLLTQQSHWIVFLTMATVSLFVGMIPIKIGIRSLEQREF